MEMECLEEEMGQAVAEQAHSVSLASVSQSELAAAVVQAELSHIEHADSSIEARSARGGTGTQRGGDSDGAPASFGVPACPGPGRAGAECRP